MVGKFELYKFLDEGIDAMNTKKVRSFGAAFAEIQKALEEKQ